ncbi:hypothetical protein [Clostridium sp. FP2]|nr:hypothetical protein [Clostridium sp. FP2]
MYKNLKFIPSNTHIWCMMKFLGIDSNYSVDFSRWVAKIVENIG